MFSKVFALDLLERAIKTVAQTMLALITMDGVNIFSINYKEMFAAAATAGLISVLTSIVTAGVRERGTASLVVNPPLPPPNNNDIRG